MASSGGSYVRQMNVRYAAEGLKYCSCCNEVKPMSAFNKRSAASDGLQSYCKVCTSKVLKDLYRKRKKAKELSTGASFHAGMSPVVKDEGSIVSVKPVAKVTDSVPEVESVERIRVGSRRLISKASEATMVQEAVSALEKKRVSIMPVSAYSDMDLLSELGRRGYSLDGVTRIVMTVELVK